MRATAVLTLQMCATPFMSGIMRVLWKPYVANDADWGAFERLHSLNIVQLSQLPGVFHQVSTDTVVMRAPIIGPQNTKRLDGAAAVWNFGFFEAYVFAPLLSGAANTVTVRAFLSFEDAEVDTPYFNQAGKNTEVEEKKAKGIVSGTAGGLIPVVRGLNSIPMLSSICGPAEWFLKVIKGGAEAVGWSKPQVSDTMMRVTSNVMYYGPNCNGADASVSLSTDGTNSVTTLARSSIYSPADEMSIDFIKSQWAYLANVRWNFARAVGDQLYIMDHRPSAYTQLGSFPLVLGSITTYYMTPICFLANLFDNWRGDVEVKLVFSKTGFHTGTMSITYVPTRGSAALTYVNSPYNFREIIDIQTCEEFCFTLPYSLPDPYLPFDTCRLCLF